MVVLMKTLLAFTIAALLASPQQQTQPDKPDRVVNVSAERFSFNPSKITLKQGQTVELVLVSDDTDHGFKIAAAGIDVAIPPSGRGEARVRFTARDKGRFVFECSRPCGAGHNLMRGYIEVK
jgi:cytochrome c oxidase subunit 2